MRSVLEVCVDSTASALAAKRGGASRLELCADLIVGGSETSVTTATSLPRWNSWPQSWWRPGRMVS